MKLALALLLALQFGAFDQPKPKSYIVYAADQQTIAAGKHAVLKLHFHVVDGYHVNSHTPNSELLIPTRIEFQPANGVQASPAEYPSGHAYSFASDPSEKLDVYTGDFIVRLPVVATPGSHTVAGTLKYQACDNAACYPPKSLPIQVLFVAR
jgi:hypothetical protein